MNVLCKLMPVETNCHSHKILCKQAVILLLILHSEDATFSCSHSRPTLLNPRRHNLRPRRLSLHASRRTSLSVRRDSSGVSEWDGCFNMDNILPHLPPRLQTSWTKILSRIVPAHAGFTPEHSCLFVAWLNQWGGGGLDWALKVQSKSGLE